MVDHQSRRAMLKELWDSGELVNGTILTEDGGTFRIHLEVLMGRSPYFKSVVSAAKNSRWNTILVPGISKETVGAIIGFMYSDQLTVSSDKVDEMLRAGELLGIPDVVTFCKRFLISSLKEDNCFELYSKYFQYEDVRQEAMAKILTNFQRIFSTSSEFLNLPVDELVALLSNDRLGVKGEEYVFWAVMRWTEHDPSNRVVSLPNLLRCIRFGLCSSQFYERNILPHPLVLGNEECQAIILQATQLFEDMPLDDIRSLLDMRHPFLRPRTPNEVLFAMGGWSAGSATNILETFDVQSKRWFLSLAADAMPRAYHGMVWHGGQVYVIGGFDGNQFFNSVKRFDPVQRTWNEAGCMYEARCYVSVASLNNHVYAMGGFDGHRRSRTCERYHPDDNQWEMVASMNQVRSDASADVLRGKMYIAGGFNGQQVLSSAECYDPATDTWTNIIDMNSPRSGVKLVAYFDQLYIIGGFNGNSRLATVEKYDSNANVWLPMPPLQGPRSNFATAVLYDRLYVIGGFNGLATIASAECFCQQRKTWLPVTELNLNRSALAACTVKDIPNAHDYTFLGNVPFP